MRYQLVRMQQLNCDIDTAWIFFSSPHNLAKITPKQMGFEVLTTLEDMPIYKGQRIDYRISPIFNISMKWTTLITHVEHGISFVDFQERGPYKYWNHYHEFVANEASVMMKDIVDYELPLGIIGKLAHFLFVKNKLEHIFNYRYQVLTTLFSKKNI